MAQATVGTIRLHLMKVAAQEIFARAHAKLREASS